jgi:hypothetical protein
MTVVTTNGPGGSGSREIGIEVARRLDCNYVDRLILAEAAKRLGAMVEVVAARGQRPVSRGDRIVRFLQTIMERSAGAGAAIRTLAWVWVSCWARTTRRGPARR